jgi:hypothetical protein
LPGIPSGIPSRRDHHMATVQTARGARETSSLGRVLMHEHVFVL